MKIFVRCETIDADDELIIIKLSNKDKENIKNMDPECNVYASFPDNYKNLGLVKAIMEKLKDS